MMNSYLIRYRFWILRQIFLDGIAEGQSPLLGELCNCNPGEHLVHGGKIEFGVDPIGDIEDLARQAISLLKEWGSVVRYKDCAGELVICGELFQKSCKVFDDLGFLHAVLSS